MSSFDTATSALLGTAEDLVRLPINANGAQDGAARLQQPTRELLNYHFTLTKPLHRICPKLQLQVAVARLVWMMGANNRVEDMAFYEPRVRSFSDDQLTVPGSDYGMRLRQPQPGVDQVRGAIDRIKADAESRRAALTVFQPIDAIRESRDIPCAFGMFFNARNGRLDATLIMRSNNAIALLPFNIFEFSILMETVAVECGLELGSLFYFANSMHLYERDSERAKLLVAEQSLPPAPMIAMPRDSSPLDWFTKLALFDAKLRQASAGITNANIDSWCDQVKSQFDPYWSQYAALLLCSVATTHGEASLRKVRSILDRNLANFVPSSTSAGSAPSPAPTLFDQREEKVTIIYRTEAAKLFAKHAERFESEKGPIPAVKLLQTQADILDRLAARGEDEGVTYEVVAAALAGKI